jgi:ribose transport system permease protein
MTAEQGAPSVAVAPRDTRPRARIGSEAITTVVIFVLCGALILGSRLISPAFGSWSQLATILFLSAFLVFVAYGQGLVILVRGLDLSIASLITLGGILTTGWLNGSDSGAIYLLPAILLVCAAVGCVNGLGITVLRIPPFIMTLAVGIIVYSLCLGYTEGTPRGYAPPALVAFMRATWLDVPAPIYLLGAFVVVGAAVQSLSVFGRWMYAVGNNPVAAHVAGLPTRRITIAAYAVSALCAGFTGVMLAAYANGATLRMGDDYLLPSIAAVVVGGSSILGGQGSFLGTVGGAILLTTLGTIMSALGIEQGWKTIIEGAVILLALVLLREQAYDALRSWLGRERR